MALGYRRLVALGVTGIGVFLLVGVSGYLLSRPQQEVLYSGLDAQDVTRIGAALEDAGIGFDISVAGDSVLVGVGHAARARMLLAQKGLPRSDSAGYELFDKLGSLGLTSFMQQVTKVRALEGELARTIQLIDGIKAARVHLALKSEGSFRNPGEQATASVIVRADEESSRRAANAIRHLVAASIPGLAPAQVSVMSADGTILLSTGDDSSGAPESLMGLERSLASDIEARVTRTMVPYLGASNLRVSVAARLNADRRQISQTEFDPNSRVERSVRTIKESGEAQNASSSAGVTAEQNIPVEEAPKSSGDNSSERKDRKEELTNYEINSKSVSTTSEGYTIERLSIAVVVNRAALVAMLGGSPTEEVITARLAEIKDVVASAAGVDDARGDVVQLRALDFVSEEAALEPVAGESWSDLLAGSLGGLVNAGALIIVTLLVLFLGLRPALRLILGTQPTLEKPADMASLPPMDGLGASALGSPLDSVGPLATIGLSPLDTPPGDPFVDNLAREISSSPRERLTKIVELDPDRAAEVLKRWLKDGGEKAA